MNISEELDRMIAELGTRTQSSPLRIMCNHDTLDQLWSESGMVYSSQSDIDNGTGYDARYNGTPIVVYPGIETGKFLLVPDQSVTRPIDFQLTATDTDGGHWWVRSPFARSVTAYGNGPFQVSFDPVATAHEDEEENSSKESVKSICIDEDSFLNILKGGEDHDAP